MRKHLFRLISLTFSTLIFLNVASGESFGEKILKKWKMSNVAQIESIKSGASEWLYPFVLDCDLTSDIPQSGWSLHYVDSEELVGEDGAATNAFDGVSSTIWHTEWYNGNAPLPHEIQINLGDSYNISGFDYLPRQNSSNGRIANYAFYISTDGVSWGSALASGAWTNNTTEMEVALASPQIGQYIRLVATSEVNGNPFTSIAELNVRQCISPEICDNGIDDDGDGLVDCDDSDCTFTINKTIEVNCVGNNDGSVDITVNGGEAPYFFDWDNDGTGDNDDPEDLNGLGVGTYNVTVTDANGCTATANISITLVNEYPFSAMLLTGADNTPFPTSTYTGGYYFEFPTGADSFDFSFDHSFIPTGYSLDTNWLGTGTMHYEMTDANTVSNAYQFVGDRVTEFSDFNPGDVPNESGRIYDVYGRGHFTYNSGSDPGGHNWVVTYDFTTMVNGFLPAGTMIGFVDIDGIALNGESVLLTATVPSGNNDSWLNTPPYDFGYDPPEFPHSQPTYSSSNKSYYFNGPSATNTAIAYLTAKDLTSITMELTHGKSGGSYGMKFAGPIYPDSISVNTTDANCIANDGTITFNTAEDDLEFSINNGSTFQNSNIFSGLSPGTYNAVVRNKDTGCERLVSAAAVQVPHNPCQEICNNGVDDDFDGLIDCEDEDCNWIGISNITVSSCINHPFADVATLEIDVDWDYAPPGDLLVVSIAGKSEYIQVDYLAPPQLVTFNIPADGSTNNPITASWYVNDDLCESTATYSAPESCSSDELVCNILYISGNYLPGDGDAWDQGWINYLDNLNGVSVFMHVLAKPDASGLGLYDPNAPSTPVSILFSDYDLIIVSATTQQQVSNDLINTLRDAPQVVLNSNYKLLNDFGMTEEEGFYLLQDYAFIDNSTQRALYKFNNIYPNNIETITHGDYLPIASVDLWAEAGGYNAGTGGVMFGFDVLDNMPGVAADHGKRVYLGYRMEGVYANAENAGVLPVPTNSVFDPVKHLTLLGKYYFDLALVQATSNCSGVENCYNEIDDDGDGLTDCKDPDCTPIPIAAVSAQYRTIKDGNWTNANTWLGGVPPPTGNIQGVTISIEHEVILNGDAINLQNGSKLWVTNGGLEMKAGGLTINGTTVNITNSYLITWSGYDVILTGNKPKLNIANSAVDIGGSFENANGNRVLENVCLTVADAYINSSKDSLRNVCATVATEPTGSFLNSVYSQIYFEDTELNIEKGDLQNNLLASIDGSNLKLWVQNGSVVNAGFWTADITHHCVSGANGVPAYLLFQPEECTNISWYFDNCDCGCAPDDEVCDSGIDEDGDGLFDCEDDDCAGIVDAGENVASCSGEDVTLTANLISGNGSFTYAWSHGLGSSTSVVVSPTATTVYSVTITNAQGCSSSDSVTVTIGVCSEICTNGIDDDGDGLIDCNDPDCRLTITGFPLSPICYAGNDGSINTTTTGGKNPYSYTWSTGETSADINQLFAGTYLVTVSDTYGCSATASFDVSDGYQISIGAEIEHSNCYGDAAGSINLSVTGGVQPYSFAWTNGETTEDINSLTAGVYGVTVSDANSCSTTGFYTVFHALNAAYETYYIPLPEQNIRSSLSSSRIMSIEV